MQIVEEKTNPWLLQKMKEKELVGSTQVLDLVVEVEYDRTAEVADRLEAIEIEVKRELISWGRYIPIRAPVERIPEIQRVPYVVMVHYDVPRYIYQPPSIVDPLIGEIQISPIEVPTSPLTHPLEVLTGVVTAPLGLLEKKQPQRPGVIILPNTIASELVGAPVRAVQTKVAVLDTGAPFPFHPHWRKPIEAVSFTGELPVDGQGHGTYCTCQAFGVEFLTRFGWVRGTADGQQVLHGKVLTNAGFGTTSMILRGMEWAYHAGAKIVSMSLGGPNQGGMLDPEVRVVEELKEKVIFVIAAGNQGPDEWTIGSPGCAPSALTIGSYSPYYKGIAWWSSRGPSSEWFKNHPAEWEDVLARYGENAIKPDLVCPGGGPVEKDQPTDLLYGGTQGWYDGFYDLTPGDWFEAFRGTSMATPVGSGLVAHLYEEGKVRTAADVKSVMRGIWGKPKDIAWGYGLIHYDYFEGKSPTEKQKIKLKIV